MTREWKPGDVAMVEVGCHANRHVAIKVANGWRYARGDEDLLATDEPAITTARPLVVIDDEDREQVERLVRLFWDAQTDDGDDDTTYMQAALREFANPRDPKPNEPQGLGAVIEDAEGELWIRTCHPCDNCLNKPWQSGAVHRHWQRVAAVHVLSDGVVTR